MLDYYLAIDIGASSVKIFLGCLKNDNLQVEEIHRFETKTINKGGHIFWNLNHLVEQIIVGLKVCAKLNKIPKYVGIDTFGVDYCLLDDNNNIIGDVYSYRDNRTKKMVNAFHKKINKTDYFKITGIQPQSYNTLYQLYHDKINSKLNENVKIVMLSSYLAYYFTGIIYNEKTIFSTTGLLDVNTQFVSNKLLKILGLTSKNFPPLVRPGTIIGEFKESVAKEIGFKPTMVAVCQHDTASAVVASIADEKTLYLSSGTWSLIGITSKTPLISPTAYKTGFTNELGFNNQYRILKNIIGLWMIQQVKKENHHQKPIEEIILLAKENSTYEDTIDVSDEKFLNPVSMTETIKNYLLQKGMRLYSNIGELYYLIYNSLAKSYAQSIKEIEKMTKTNYTSINVVGGGSQNELLTELTTKHSKKKVISGPIEGTAIGNIIVQLIIDKKINYNKKNELLKSLKEGEVK